MATDQSVALSEHLSSSDVSSDIDWSIGAELVDLQYELQQERIKTLQQNDSQYQTHVALVSKLKQKTIVLERALTESQEEVEMEKNKRRSLKERYITMRQTYEDEKYHLRQQIQDKRVQTREDFRVFEANQSSREEEKIYLLEMQATMLYQELEKQEEEKSRMEEENTLLKSTTIELQQQIKRMEDLEMKDLLHDMEDRYRNAMNDNCVLKRKQNELEKVVIQKQKQVEIVEFENSELTERLEGLKKQNHNKQQELEALNKQLSARNAEINTLLSDLKGAGVHMAPEGVIIDTNQAKREALQRDVLRKAKRIEDLEAQIELLQQTRPTPDASSPQDSDQYILLVKDMAQKTSTMEKMLLAKRRGEAFDLLELMDSMEIREENNNESESSLDSYLARTSKQLTNIYDEMCSISAASYSSECLTQ